ncbi:MAG: hypothetical protein KKB30_15450 [Proteobacteria bacterium]|nr:hypothetical protein [Pseudomonadota bacterium]MBU1716320.1 hypothetical protein [Pseudomonadota bacterium]
MHRILTRIILSVIFVFVSCVSSFGAEEWRSDFDRLCGYIMEIEKYTPEKLRSFVDESDKLLKIMSESKETDLKVYIFRLKKCRNFFDYMATVKEEEAASK